MFKVQNSNDTICAPATPAGGALGIIRVSGPDAIRCVDSIFSRRLTHQAGYTLCYGNVMAMDGSVIDEVVTSVFRAPHSYTGEDAVELSCHGSSYIMSTLLHRLIESGCRAARPGEFTMRAFLNGKMDLAQAEAVADLIASTNRATHRLAMGQLKGNISSELSTLRQELLRMTSLLELELDFSDHEDLEFADRHELRDLAHHIDNRVTKLANSFHTGQALREGVAVAIVGKTNVGKSTLLNCLLKEDKAIVSDVHGTTRDYVEGSVEIKGITFRFIDTAGLRTTSDRIEQMGIERTLIKIGEAAIVIWLIDEAPTVKEIATMQQRCVGKHLIVVQNKIDNDSVHNIIDADLRISAKQNINIDALREALFKASGIPEISQNDVLVTNARHYAALQKAHDGLARVLEGIDSGLSADLLSEDLRTVLSALGEITGTEITPRETLNNIFSHFCIGK